MRFVTSLSLSSSLAVVVVEDDNGIRIRYDIDPMQDPVQEHYVFIKQVTDIGAFLEKLVDRGYTGDGGFEGNAVDVPTTPPNAPWPKLQVVIEYAQVVHSEELAALNAISNAA